MILEVQIRNYSARMRIKVPGGLNINNFCEKSGKKLPFTLKKMRHQESFEFIFALIFSGPPPKKKYNFFRLKNSFF